MTLHQIKKACLPGDVVIVFCKIGNDVRKEAPAYVVNYTMDAGTKLPQLHLKHLHPTFGWTFGIDQDCITKIVNLKNIFRTWDSL